MAGALVLAGGGSSRMGRDKATLVLGGRPLLARVLDCLRGSCDPLVVSARPGQVLPTFEFAYQRVDDPVAGAGPLVGLVAGLERLAALEVREAYVGACDAAALSETHVEFMLARLREGSGPAAVPCELEGFVHPLAAAVRVAPMLQRARAALEADQHRLQRLFRGPGIDRVKVEALPDAGVLAPCNTPDQLRALSSRLGLPTPPLG